VFYCTNSSGVAARNFARSDTQPRMRFRIKYEYYVAKLLKKIYHPKIFEKQAAWAKKKICDNGRI
jgi:hypothetical protein